MNICYRDFPSAIRGTVHEPKKNVLELAKEVIDGLWGNGDDRKSKLTQAGHNPSEVQKKVNELLKNK